MSSYCGVSVDTGRRQETTTSADGTLWGAVRDREPHTRTRSDRWGLFSTWPRGTQLGVHLPPRVHLGVRSAGEVPLWPHKAGVHSDQSPVMLQSGGTTPAV